jgi:peptidoglycan/xylan/chitin deacetylase (PgdA/CDA1 family)
VGRLATWFACGLVAVLSVAGGVVLDRFSGWGFPFTIGGSALGVSYLVGTFAITAPFFGRVARARDESGRFALTFDDGPDVHYTPKISRVLAQRGHRATFFVLGRHAAEYPQVLARILADGHELASHGFDHRLLAFTRPRTVRAQLLETEQAVAAATGSAPVRLFRPPHGVRSLWLGRTAASLGYRVCGWTGIVFDTARPGAAAIVERVSRHLRPGSILLLHDCDGSGRGADRSQTVEALPAILDEAERRGLRSVQLSSLLEPPRAPLPVPDPDGLGLPGETGFARLGHPLQDGD